MGEGWEEEGERSRRRRIEGGGGGEGEANLKLTYLYNDCFLIISQAYHTFIFVRPDCINTPS